MFTLRYWGGGTGPWLQYKDDTQVKFEGMYFRMNKPYETVEQAVEIAKARVGQWAKKKYPIGVFEDGSLVLQVYGDSWGPPFPEFPTMHYSEDAVRPNVRFVVVV